MPLISSHTFPAITLEGSAPTFYKIPVTQNLVDAVTTAQYPPDETIVCKLLLPLPNIVNTLEEGMVPLENRRIMFQCFEAFKLLLW
jgi:hypothetical protein